MGGTSPDKKTVIVDPAGLPYIQSSPSGAGGASGQIYEWLRIDRAYSFPDPVKAEITEPLKAKFHNYGGKLCIHVVGPNFQMRPRTFSWEEGLGELTQAYSAALSEFAASGFPCLRLLPISSSIFAGSFAQDMPEM